MWHSYLVLVIAIAVFAFMLLAMSVGTRLALAHDDRTEEDMRHGTTAIEGALFALLGLLLAFMFSGAASRFIDRRDLIVSEANSIGTAYLRLDLLPTDAQPSLRQLFRDYADARIRGFELLPDSEAWDKFDEAKLLQTRIWREAVAAAPNAGNPTALTLVLNPINDMIDITATHEAALYSHPPAIFYVLMVALAIVCSALAGRSMASRRFGKGFYRITFAAIFAFTFMVILDTEFPRAGFITVKGLDDALVQARSAMN